VSYPGAMALCSSVGQLLDAGTVQLSTNTPPPPNAKGPAEVLVLKLLRTTAISACRLKEVVLREQLW